MRTCIRCRQQFVATGAIQCGYCTPAQLLAAKRLLDENPNPTEAQVREAIAGVLCRCTGYVKPVEAILPRRRADARRRTAAPGHPRDGRHRAPATGRRCDDAGDRTPDDAFPPDGIEPGGTDVATQTRTLPVHGRPAADGRREQTGAQGRRGQAEQGPRRLRRRRRDAGHVARRPAHQPARPRPHRLHRQEPRTGPARRTRRAHPRGRARASSMPAAGRAIPIRRPTTR